MARMNHTLRTAERGNAIWFILIAIALVAALTITITRSTDTVEQSGDVERERISASNVMSYAKSLDQAVKQMSGRGVSENAISFDVRFLSGYANPSCADSSCKLFEASGGGQNYKVPPSDWLDSTQSAQPSYGEWYIPEALCVAGVGTGDSGCGSDSTNNEDLVLVLPWIKRPLCLQINKLSGVNNPGGSPPQIAGDAFVAGYLPFTGSFSSEGGEISDAGGALSGKRGGCFEGNNIPPAGSYHYYYVLIDR